jgi:hypothetical protein
MSQDYLTLEFVYIFRQGDNRYVVKTDADYVINSGNEASITEQITTLISANHFTNYIDSIENGAGFTKVTVKTAGYASTLTSEITFDATNVITVFVTNVAAETFNDDYNSGYSVDNGNPATVIPNAVITNQTDLSLVSVVSGASVTSRSLIHAASLAISYMEAING